MTSRSSKTFECITECIWDGTFERHFQRVVLINHLNGFSFCCCNDAFRLAHSGMYPCSIWFLGKQGQVWAWGQFRFVRTEPSSNSILKSISGRFRVNSIHTRVEKIDTKFYSTFFEIGLYCSYNWICWKVGILKNEKFKANFQAKWVFNRWEISERELSKEKIDKEGIKNAQVKFSHLVLRQNFMLF